MKRRAVLLATSAVAAVALLLTSGCNAGFRDATAPTCSSQEGDPLFLVAQSVPTADRVPCINSYPAGWKLGEVVVRNGRSSFTLDATDSGAGGLTVTLRKECAVTDATEVPTDEPGTVRYDRIPSTGGTFRMVRTYTFAGGCVNYDFHFGHRAGDLVDEASFAVGFVARTDVDARFRHVRDANR